MTPEMLDSIIADLCNSPDLKFSQRYALQSLRKDRNDLQSQLAAANERADAAVKALAYVIRDLEIRAGTSGVVELGHGAYLQAKRVLDQNVRLAGADAPVPAQPAVVPKHAADWFHDMREVLFDIATSDVICDRPEHAFVTVAIDRDTLSRAAILSTTDTEVKK